MPGAVVSAHAGEGETTPGPVRVAVGYRTAKLADPVACDGGEGFVDAEAAGGREEDSEAEEGMGVSGGSVQQEDGEGEGVE